MARELIDSGRVHSWAQLGRALGISGQAANQRFGAKGLGLEIPKRPRRFRTMVSVSLDDDLHRQLLAAMEGWPGGTSKAEVVRSMLARQLLEEVGS